MFKRLLAGLGVLFATSAFAAVDVNKATQAELEAVKGIGPSMAEKILDVRKHGPFKDWADFVARVSGVGQGNASRFSAGGLTVEGVALPAAAASAPAPKR